MPPIRPKSNPRRGDITRDQVIEAALACLDRDGLDDFSLRAVARDLGVFPTAIYWHVPDGRNGLLAGVAARVLHGITPPQDPGVVWQHWLLELFRRYRTAIRAHPNAAPLLGARLVSNPGVQAELVDGVVWALERAGYAGAALVDAYNAVIAGMVGFVTLEFARAPDDDTAAWCAAQRGHVAELADGRYPTVARHAPALAGHAFILRWEDGVRRPLDSGFEYFATALINGLQHTPGRISN
jgi:TetR/AcrR family tetracycline transcriptional repressor